MWSGALFSDRNNKKYLGTGAIFLTKRIKIVGSGALSDSLFNDKNEIKAKSNAFSFCLIFFSKG